MFDIKKLGDDVLKGQIHSVQRDIKALKAKKKKTEDEDKDLVKQQEYLHQCVEEANARGWVKKDAKGKDKKDGEGEDPTSEDPPTKE